MCFTSALISFCPALVCFDPDRLAVFFCFSGFSGSLFSWALWETHGSLLLPVNKFGDDEELSTSSDTDEEVIKQFEISVSRSQSLRSGASEKGRQAGLEQKPKARRWLSTHKEDSKEVPACKGILCIKPFLFLDQEWLMVRVFLSLYTFV